MAAWVEHDFKSEFFLLSEEHLRKIHEIIKVRMAKLQEAPVPIFFVYRGDSYSYDTESIEDVLNEDNNDWRQIRRLDVATRKESKFRFNLTFGAHGIKLFISGEDRDSVFLLFSDLREYIRNEMLRVASRREIGRMFLLVLGVGLLVAAVIYAFISGPGAAEFGQAMAGGNANEKLNFLIEERARMSAMTKWATLALVAGVLLVALADGAVFSWGLLLPAKVFLFGKQKLSFERRARIVANIFWVVGIGGAVSIIAGVIVWWATK